MIQFALLAFPAIVSLLTLVVLRKAGFGALPTLLGLAPLVGAALPMLAVALARQGVVTVPIWLFPFVPLAGQILGLAPLVALAFLRWPRLEAV